MRGVDITGAVGHQRLEILSDVLKGSRHEDVSLFLGQLLVAVKVVDVFESVRRGHTHPQRRRRFL